MNKESNISSRGFIQQVLIEETGKLVKNGSYHFAFMVMAQGLETLGSFLDDKPLKARTQSKQRFSLAINKLMPKEYHAHNNNHALYDRLRASMAHTLTVGKPIYLTTRNNKDFSGFHLHIRNEKLILVCEFFYAAFVGACNKVLSAMDNGIVSIKKCNAMFYYTF